MHPSGSGGIAAYLSRRRWLEYLAGSRMQWDLKNRAAILAELSMSLGLGSYSQGPFSYSSHTLVEFLDTETLLGLILKIGGRIP
jgi:predicted membrane-bound spermidine synthase